MKPISLLEPGSAAGSGAPLRGALIFPVGNIHAAPSVINAVLCLAHAGCHVDVYLLRNSVAREVRFDLPNVRVILTPWTVGRVREPRITATLAFGAWLLLRRRWNYDFVLVAGLRSVIAAWIVGWVRRMRLVNLQLELYIGAKLDSAGRAWIKRIERSVVGRAIFSIIQDERRAELLMADLGIPRDRIELVPNGPLGPASRARTDFLQRRLGLVPGTRVLLCPGSICEEMLASEVVRGAQRLPDGWVCVLHSSLAVEADDPYVRKLRDLNTHGRVIFSLDPVPYEQVGDLFSSATVGLALYGESGGQNTVEVGLASGKLNHFLKHGVPVVVSDLGALGRFVRDRKVGVPVKNADDLPAAVREVANRYEEMSENAARVFDRELAFEARFETVVERMRRELAPAPTPSPGR